MNSRSAGGCRVADTITPTPAALLVDARAACVMLALGSRRLWLLTNRRAIPCYRVGRSVRYAPAELARWVASGCPTDAGAADRLRKGARE